MLDERFNSLGRFLKDTFGERVNRMNIYIPGVEKDRVGGDGAYSLCAGELFEQPYPAEGVPSVEEQIAGAKERIRQKYKFGKYIVHFHTYADRYVGISSIENTIYETMKDDEIIGINLTVRLDTLDDKLLRLLGDIHNHIYLWVETGFHTIHDDSLKKIGMPLTCAESIDKIFRLLSKGLRVSPHVVFGLPGETPEMMHQTMKRISSLLVNGVNVSHFLVTTGSPFENDYRAGKLPLLERDEYVALVCDLIEMLPKNVVLRRLVGEAKREVLAGPEWTIEKQENLSMISAELDRRNSRQGKKNPNCFYEDEDAVPPGTGNVPEMANISDNGAYDDGNG